MKYKHAVVGGTFDHLHLGHQDLLSAAFDRAAKATIGLATEKIYRDKFLSHSIEAYQERENSLKDFLRSKNFLSRAKIVLLNDIFGPTIDDNDMDSIFVTEETYPNALKVNQERKKKGLKILEIVKIPFRKDDSGEDISSERIRLGEIDRDGHFYMNVFKNKNKLMLPSDLRNEMRQPVGEIFTDIKKIKPKLHSKSLLISVGDIVTRSFNEIECVPDISIIDFRTRRHELDHELLKKFLETGKSLFKNEPATISKLAVEAFKSAVDTYVAKHEKQAIVIDGEEDLLTLPAILLAPLGSYVCYGQFDLEAVIFVEVTEEKKQFIFELLKKFE